MLCCVARYEADESSDEELVHEYTHVTMQLLDLMHVLFSRAMGVQTAWERETSELWDLAWCPVLQVSQLQCCSAAGDPPSLCRAWRGCAATPGSRCGPSPSLCYRGVCWCQTFRCILFNSIFSVSLPVQYCYRVFC